MEGNSSGHNGKDNGRDNGKHSATRKLLVRAKHAALEYAVAQALTVLGKTSEGNYEKLAAILERAAGSNENKKMVARWVHQWFSPRTSGTTAR